MGDSLRDYLDERLAAGEFPRGSWLPSVRDLSVLLSVNRNTVSRIYQSLERDGVVRRVPGRGMFVVATDRRAAARRADDLQEDAERLVRRAHEAGVVTTHLYELVRRAAGVVRSEARVRVSLVECNREAAESLAAKLSAGVHMRVDYLLLSGLRGLRGPDRPDVLVTTFFHLNELAAFDTRSAVVGVRHEMSYETLMAISRLAHDQRVVIVCPNQRTLDRVAAAVRSYTRCDAVPVVADKRKDLETALRDADAAVVAWGTHDIVKQVRPDLPLIVVEYEIDAQSIAVVRRAVVAIARGLSSEARRHGRRRAETLRHAVRRGATARATASRGATERR